MRYDTWIYQQTDPILFEHRTGRPRFTSSEAKHRKKSSEWLKNYYDNLTDEQRDEIKRLEQKRDIYEPKL